MTMSVQELETVVGVHTAARLVILKSKLDAQRFAPARKEEDEIDLNPSGGLITTVTRITTWTNHTNLIQFACGHGVVLEEDETNYSLIGAEVACDMAHR